MKNLVWLVVSVAFIVGCTLKKDETPGGGSGGNSGLDLSKVFTAQELRTAVVSAAKILVQRLPSQEEMDQAASGLDSYEMVLRKYLNEPAFLETMRAYHAAYFEMGGLNSADNINYNEPTNLALKIIRDNLDYRQIALAKYCVDDGLNEIPCNTFAGNSALQDAQAAGILTTRGFMAKWANNFNFRRVNKAFRVLSCAEYPDALDLGHSTDDLGNDEGRRNFANSDTSTGLTNCFSCHKNINARAVPYFNYGRKGLYTTNVDTSTDHPDNNQPNATISQLLKAGVTPMYDGQPLTKVRDYAEQVVKSERFKVCLVQRFRAFVFGKSHLEPLPAAMARLVDNVEADNYNVREVLVDIMTHYLFIKR